MKIQLDHIQRLNLHALLGAQRGDLATIRAFWALQDKLALTADEEKAIELKREVVGSEERLLWNPALTLPPKELDVTEAEVARICAALDAWSSYGVTTERRWLEPLLEALAAREPQS